MKFLQLLLVISSFGSFSCQSSNEKNENAFSKSRDTTNARVVTIDSLKVDTAGFIATLRHGIEKVNATINDSTMFVATNGQLFLYDNESQGAWIADGRFGYIPKENVVRLDTTYFKFDFSAHKFVYDASDDLSIGAKREGIDLNSLVKQIQNKNNKALQRYYDLKGTLDGAAAEAFYYELWALINLWSDDEFVNFIESLSSVEKIHFSNTLLVRMPIPDIIAYFRLYYPKTLAKIIALK